MSVDEATEAARGKSQGTGTGAWSRELCIAISVFAAAAIFSMAYLASYTRYPTGYWQQWWLTPAALMASGHGFADVDNAPPVLSEFLKRNIEELPAGSLPSDLVTKQASPFHFAHRYLLYAVAAAWYLFGISWRALLPVYGILCGLTALSTYGLCRLGMGRLMSIAITALFLVSPIHLYALPLLRDYGKAPFFLGAVFLVGYLIRHPLSFRKLLALSAALGVVGGIGFGFRMDVLIAYWGAVMTVVIFLPGTPWSTWQRRLAAAAIMMVSFNLSAWPILHPPVTLNMSAHAAQGGFVQTHDRQLGVAGVPYTWTRLMNDYYMFAYVEANAHYADGNPKTFDYLSPEHQKAGWGYLKNLTWYFPADVMLRVLASTLRIVEQAPIQDHPNSPDSIDVPTPFIWGSYRVLEPVWAALPWLSPLCTILGIGLMASICVRRGVALAFLLFMFGGYCFLQFEVRHYFHLAVLPLWFLGFTLSAIGGGLWRLRNEDTRRDLREMFHPAKLRSLSGPLTGPALLVALALGLLLTVGMARLVQRHQVAKLYQNYLGATLEPVAFDAVPDTPQPGLTLLKPKGLFDAASWSEAQKAWNTQTEMLAIEFEDPKLQRMWYWPRYSTPQKFFDLTYYAGNTRLAPELCPTSLHFEPIFEAPPTFRFASGQTCGPRTFDGIAVLNSQVKGIKALYRVHDPGKLGFILSLTLPKENWERAPRCERFQPYPLPAPIRAIQARDENLLADGGFETVDADGGIEGFGLPQQGSTVVSNTQFCSEGSRSATQRWSEADAKLPPTDRFHLIMNGLDPGREYELFVSAKQTVPGSVSLEAWQMPEKVFLGRLFNVTAGEGFREFRGAFKTPEEPGKDVVICTALSAAPAPEKGPLEVTWDDWRMVPAPDYGEAIHD